MTKFTLLEDVVAPIGDEPVVIISGGRVKRTRFDRLVSPAIVLVNQARDAAVTAINLLAASAVESISALVASAKPINYEKLSRPSIHRPPPHIADANGNATLTIFQNWALNAPYLTRQAINAGQPIEFTVTKISGTPAASGKMQIVGGAEYAMVATGDTLTFRGIVPVGTMTLRFQSTASGAVTYGPVSLSVVGGITLPTDHRTLSSIGAKEDEFDQGTALVLNGNTFGGPANFPLTQEVTLPANTNFAWVIDLVGDFVAGEPINYQFDCPVDLQTVVQSVAVAYNNGITGAATGHQPVTLDYDGDGRYSVRDYFDPPAGASVKPVVFRMQANNTTAAAITLKNHRAHKANTPPVHTKVPARVTKAIDDRVRIESSYGAWLLRFLINGDSTFAPHFNSNIRSIGYFLNQLLQGRGIITELGAQGAKVDQILAANDLWNLTGDVVGNYIPRNGDEFEFANWNYAPVTIRSLDNLQNNCRASIAGTDVVFTRGTFGGATGAWPIRLWGRGVNRTAKDPYIPPGSRVTMQQGRSASRYINVIQTSSINGSLVGSDGAAYAQWYAMRCAGRSADFIARQHARTIFMPAIAGTPAGIVPASPNLGSTAAVNSLLGQGCPQSCILDPNAPQGAPGSGTGGLNRQYFSAIKLQYLTALTDYVVPTAADVGARAILYQQQQQGHRSDDLSRYTLTGDSYHQNEYYNACRAIDIFLCPLVQALLNNPD